ncbi:MAG: APC family permease [bacterium]
MATPSENSGSGLRRELGLFTTVNISVGLIIGAGIFAVPSVIAGHLDSMGLILGVWIVGGLMTLSGAFAFGELAAAMPQTGGTYVYLREGYGPLIAFLFGWAQLLVINSGSYAALSTIFASYVNFFVPTSIFGTKLIASGAVALVTALNFFGVKKAGAVQNVLTPLKVGVLLFIIGCGFLLGKGDWTNVTPIFNGFNKPGLLAAFGLALVSVLWTYDGWMDICYASGEVKNPERTLPRTFVLSIASLVVVYLLVNLVYHYVLPHGDIQASDMVAADVAAKMLGPIGGTLIAITVILSTFTALNSTTLTGVRIFFAMARDGLFFKWVAKAHPRFHTPTGALLISGVWSLLLILSGTFEQLATYFIFITWLFYGLAVGAVLVLRKKQPDLPRPYKTVGYPVTPIFFILAAALLLLNTVINSAVEALAGLGLLLLGVPVYFFWRRKHKSQ